MRSSSRRLGEAGLAAAVAADDEREAGAGREVERRLLPDAAEALDGEAAEEGDARRGFVSGCCSGSSYCRCARRCLCRAVVELLLQLALAFERGQHERAPFVVAVGRGVEPLQDDVAQRRVRHADLPCPTRPLPSGHSASRWLRWPRGYTVSMQVFTAWVKGGAIVPDEGVTLPEGSRVTVIADDREAPLELTAAQEAELAESIAEADRGEVISAAELLCRLSG